MMRPLLCVLFALCSFDVASGGIPEETYMREIKKIESDLKKMLRISGTEALPQISAGAKKWATDELAKLHMLTSTEEVNAWSLDARYLFATREFDLMNYSTAMSISQRIINERNYPQGALELYVKSCLKSGSGQACIPQLIATEATAETAVEVYRCCHVLVLESVRQKDIEAAKPLLRNCIESWLNFSQDSADSKVNANGIASLTRMVCELDPSARAEISSWVEKWMTCNPQWADSDADSVVLFMIHDTIDVVRQKEIADSWFQSLESTLKANPSVGMRRIRCFATCVASARGFDEGHAKLQRLHDRVSSLESCEVSDQVSTLAVLSSVLTKKGNSGRVPAMRGHEGPVIGPGK